MKNKFKKYGIFFVIFGLGIGIGIFFRGSKENITTKNFVEKKQWTCSMHPQISQPEKGDCPICGMNLILGKKNSEAVNFNENEFEMSAAAMALAEVEVSEVRRENIENTSVELLGKVAIDKNKLATQTAHFKGRLEKFYVQYKGQFIKKGQRIAKIYAPDILIAQKELLTALPFKKENPEIYEAIKEKLKLWKFTETTIQKIEKSKKVTAYFPIYSDFSGVILEIMTEKGSHVKKGAGFFKIAPLHTVWANFDAYERHAGLFKIGDSLKIKNINGDSQKAKITFIEPLLDPQKRTFQIRASLKNPNGLFKLGMFLKAKLQKKIPQKNIKIPKTAVLWTGKRSVVYVKNSEKNIFKMREIVLYPDVFENFYAVKKGVAEGEYVVSKGVFTVDSEAQLLGKKSMMNAHFENENIPLHFGVRGNCEMCKSTIEKAAKSVTGVLKAVWDRKNKRIDLVLDEKIKIMNVHRAIAKAGYDTDKINAKKQDYEKLFSCCKYDRKMKMNQK